MKKYSVFVIALLVAALLAGCAGTPVVYYTNCTCPVDAHTAPAPTEAAPVLDEGALKTGLAIITSTAKSESAKQAEYDVTLAAVLVDDSGVIYDCVIDSIGTTVAFDATGTVTADLAAQILSKNELGDNYGMKAYGGAKYEWYEQAAALADFAVGKTVAELKNGAIDESGKAPAGTDLATTATIYLGGYVGAVEAAVENAKHLGAQSGDELKLASVNSIGSSKSATADKAGCAQLDATVTALSVRDGVITSCYIDSVQAKVEFDTAGTITTDLTAPIQTKNQLGENYGMVAWGGAIAEWDAQAASFAQYVTGKTAEQVANIAVSEGKVAQADLAASVTIAIGDFQALIAKAMG